jgi:hypothetical protein
MLDVTRNLLTCILDCFRESEAIGQAGEAVAKHFSAKRAFGLQLDGSVDDAEKAARFRAFWLRQRSKLDPVELG